MLPKYQQFENIPGKEVGGGISRGHVLTLKIFTEHVRAHVCVMKCKFYYEPNDCIYKCRNSKC